MLKLIYKCTVCGFHWEQIPDIEREDAPIFCPECIKKGKLGYMKKIGMEEI